METELIATDDIPAESARLYRLLQSDVDHQMQQTGFVPPASYGMDPGTAPPANPPATSPFRRTTPFPKWGLSRR